MIADDNNMSCKFRRAMSVIYIVYICVCCHSMQGALSSFKWKTLLHNSIMCRNLEFLNLQAFISCWFLQTIYLGWGIRLSLQTDLVIQTNHCRHWLPHCHFDKTSKHKAGLDLWLITWLSTCTPCSQTEYSAMERDVQAVQSGVKTQWTKDTLASPSSELPSFLGTALLF